MSSPFHHRCVCCKRLCQGWDSLWLSWKGEVQKERPTQVGRGRQASKPLFFTDVDGKERCIDATADECSCHPDQKILGRKITHSSKVDNVRPVLCRMLLDDVKGKETNVILFQATQNIKSSERLSFNQRRPATRGARAPPTLQASAIFFLLIYIFISW